MVAISHWLSCHQIIWCIASQNAILLHLTILLRFYTFLFYIFAKSVKLRVLKKGKYHIICSWILLVCFIAGQYMVYTHQHKVAKNTCKPAFVAKNIPQQTVAEKCYLCDVMHHNVMVNTQKVYFNPAIGAIHVFKSVAYNFTSIQLILSGGRAPPTSNYLV